ncbi:MAG: dihydrofolate reductase [Ectothiorhodospiraceae bacterium AqS1]|nr:dihydrofolate reductase [Ectothiorhodospiraceae bacterium AqS1]
MPDTDDLSIGLIAAVARNGATDASLPASEEGDPSPESGGRSLFGQASRGVIGFERSIPWHLPADLAYFRKLTLDKTIIMGRCTYESIGKPLDRRINIVVSSRPGYQAQGCIVASSFADAIEIAASDSDSTKKAKDDDRPDIMIIGGECIYHQALDLDRPTRLYLTLVDVFDIQGDTFFPEFDAGQWHQTDYRERKADERNRHGMHFFDLTKQRDTPTLM